MRIYSLILSSILVLAAHTSHADISWESFTFDNDVFRGSDNGYTNGLYYSWVDTQPDTNAPAFKWLTKPLEFSLADDQPRIKACAYTLGQRMMTPSDITQENPQEGDVPYSGLLFLSNSALYVYSDYADYIGTSVGIIGPSSLAGNAQISIHEATGSTRPEGWDSQLNNELVFAFARKRSWKAWKSESDNMEILTSVSATVGTIESSVGTGFMFMYGNNLGDSFASTLLGDNRASNPVALKGGWFFFHGLNAGYTFNNIAFDGNTFEDSRSIDYKRESIIATTGVAYSWLDWSFTLALVDGNILSQDKRMDEATEYGTFTIGWVP